MLLSDEHLESMEIDPETLHVQLVAYRKLELNLEEIQKQLTQVRDDIYHTSARMDDQGFDGEFDPLEGMKRQRQELEWVVERYELELNKLCSGFCPEAKKVFDDVQDYVQEAAMEEASDRRVRWYESGCPQ